jgi:hypothetical protein
MNQMKNVWKYALVAILFASALLIALFWLRSPASGPAVAEVSPHHEKPEKKYESKNLILCDSGAETEIKDLTKGTYGYSQGTSEWDKSTGYESRSSIKISRYSDAPTYKWYFPPGQVSTKPVKNLKFGRPYTFSFYAKAEKEGTKGDISVKQFQWQNDVNRTIVLGKEWKRYSITITPEKKSALEDNNRFVLCYGLKETGVAWFDAFQFEEGDQAGQYANATPASISVHVNSTEKNTFLSSEKCAVDFDVYRAAPSSADELSVKYTVQDYSGKTVDEKTIKANFANERYWHRAISIGPDKLGWFLVTAQLFSNQNLIHEDQASLVIVAPPVVTAKGAKPFCGIEAPHHNDIAFSSQTLKKIGVKWVSVLADWGHIEKQKGVYDWNARNLLEDKVKEYRKQGYQIKVFFEGAPEWCKNEYDLAESKKLGAGYAERLLPDESHLEDWRRFVNDFVAKFKDSIDLYEIGGEVDAKYGLNPYYQKKYPEGIVERFVAGKVADTFSKMVVIASEEIKKQVPDAEIGAVRPCDVDCSDFNNTFPFSAEIFKRCGKDFNVFPLDCYPRPRYVGPDHPVTGSAYDLKKVAGGAEKMIKQFGNNQRLYISEYGDFIDHRAVRDFRYTTEQIKNMTSSYLMAGALKFKYFFWYTDLTDANALESNYYYMGIWYEDEPLPSVAAYSAVAQIVENAVDSTLIELNSNLKAAVFKKSDGTATAGIWANEMPSGIYLSEKNCVEMGVSDVMGNQILPQAKRDKRYFPIENTPIYLNKRGEGDNFQELCASIKQFGMELASPASVFFRIVDQSKAKLYLVNQSGTQSVSGKIAYSLSGKEHSEDFAVPEGGKYIMNIEIPKDRPIDNMVHFEVSFTGGYEKADFSFEIPEIAPVPRVDEKTAIAQDPEHWQIKPCIEMSDKGFLFPHDPHTAWDGPEDLSVKIYMGWSDKNLYIGAVVKDDIHFNKNINGLFNGDSLQLAFDPENTASIRPTKGYAGHDVELVLALTEQGPAAEVCYGSDKDILKKSEYAVVRNEKNKTTAYKIRLPLDAFSLAPGKAFGFNAVVFDDDTGTAQSYHFRYSEGITNGKNPQLFKKFLLK